MSKRRVMMVLLCEDAQHEAFARRFLKGMGWNTRQMRVEKSPTGKDSAEQWVRCRFPVELHAYRKRSSQATTVLVTIIDGDLAGYDRRITEPQRECQVQNVSFRTHDEHVAIIVPCRNIETWIQYLQGEKVNENDSYSKLARERDCRGPVKHLTLLCKQRELPDEAPSSMKQACNEYHGRVRSIDLHNKLTAI